MAKRTVFSRACRFVWPIVLFLAGTSPGAISAADPAENGILTLERAEFVLSDRATPPGDDAAWTEVALPHDWRLLGERRRAIGWYRVRVDVDTAPARVQGVYLRHMRSISLELFVNQQRHSGSRDIYGPGAQDYGYAMHWPVPPALWKSGENVLHFRMDAVSYTRNLHGLGRVHVGPLPLTRALFRYDWELTAGAARYAFAATLTAGLITLFLWLARRSDRVLFWFSVACLSWAIAGVPNYWLRPYVAPWLLEMCNVYVRFGMPVPAFILALRFVDRRWPRLEALLWLYLLLEVTYYIWAPALFPVQESYSFMRVLWPTASAALLFAGVAIVARLAPRPLSWPHYVEMAALGAMGLLLLQDLARYAGWVDLEPPLIRPYHVPVMLLAIGVVIFDRYLGALRRAEQATTDLERRIAEITREIEEHHRRVETARRDQALAAERQRILADMHDGLGAILVGLLRQVESGQADRGTIERRVREALQEMRIAIDALQPREGDLGNVLGNLRFRLDDSIRASGIALSWEIDPLPGLDSLPPSMVFALQRIFLEAIANTLRHSNARELRVVARAKSDDEVEIVIADDGRGFDRAGDNGGLGLANMRERAAQIGARLEIVSRPGDGTTVRICIPRQCKSSATLPGAGSEAAVSAAVESA